MSTININGRVYRGSSVSIIGGRVIIDGIVQHQDENQPLLSGVVEVRVTDGVLGHLTCDASVTCGNIDGNVSAGGSVNCSNVGGAVNAGGSIRCGNVRGPINAGHLYGWIWNAVDNTANS